MLNTCFWCVSPGFRAWEIHCDRFRTPQINLSGQMAKWTFLAISATQNMAKIVTLVLNMPETCFWCLSPGFWEWKIHWYHFQTLEIDIRLTLVAKWTFLAILASQNKVTWPNLNFGSEHFRHLFWCLSPGFGHEKFIETIFRHLRLTWVVKPDKVDIFWPFWQITQKCIYVYCLLEDVLKPLNCNSN